ncbi:VTT domain-containing protein [Alicyclobacillus sp.]|uniref:TVP38/TMEM64 family protein n=1 Tax=Alicyclobacillus sp. TaxID=61169 RepID=UPI0025C55084|nr:VTT domain-containing protein [Alicyclobacillus sp.]MCL6518042.1 VTT domain-containing protein [Alicyclobacillus sp.]
MFGHWLHVIHQGGATAAVVGFVLIVIVSYVPLLPIPVVAAAMGAVLPYWPALLAAWAAATLAAISKFWLERLFFQKHVQRVFSRYRGWDALVRFLDKNGFVAVLITRLIPVFPSALINFASAVTGISMGAFSLATALGKLPAIMTFTLAGHHLHGNVWVTVVIVTLYVLIVGWVAIRFRRALMARSDSETGPTVQNEAIKAGEAKIHPVPDGESPGPEEPEEDRTVGDEERERGSSEG